MVHGLIRFSLRYPLVVLLLAIVVLVAGTLSVRDAPWDVFPEFAPPQIVVQTEAPGFSTEEVEQLVTVPVESALGGVNRLKILRSSSVPGLSVIIAIFEPGTDVLAARQLVNERLAEVRTLLPAAVNSPRLMPLTASTSRLLMVGLTSQTFSPTQLRTWADWTFRRRLQAVRGVANVEVFGGAVKQYQVLVDPERLRQYAVSLGEIVAAARQATGFGGAGFLETANQRLTIRQRTRLESPDDLAAAPVVIRNGVPLSLGTVADVVVGAADAVGSATIDGQPGVLLIIHKQPEINTLAVTESVQEALDSLKTTLPAGVELHPVLFRQATFIERAIGNLGSSIVVGALLVTLVLVAFLFQWRMVVISLTAIPLSLLGAVLVLRVFGASLNAMTLGGLAIALGEVVDDAIVDAENVFRRLVENRASLHPRPVLDVVLDASIEVRSAVVYASFIVMLVFLPVFFLDGLPGRFFGPLGYAYVAAILVSLATALTITPAMCLVLLRNIKTTDERGPPLVRLVNNIYRRLLPPFLRHPGWTLLAGTALLVAAVAIIPGLGGELLPNFRESNFVVFMAGKPDSSLAESVRVGRQLGTRLKQIPGVASVAQQIGRADLSEDTWGPNISEVWIMLDDTADYDTVLGQVREVVEETPGYVVQVKQFLRERIDEVLTGSTADVVIRVVGPDLAVLRTQAAEIAATIQSVPGVEDLRTEQQVNVPEIEVLLRPQEAARYGFTVGEANHDIQTLLRGLSVGQVYEEDTVFDVTVRASPALRAYPTALRELLLDAPTGDKIPLKAIGNVQVTDAPNQINREQGRRRMLVTCNAEGRDVASVMADIQERLHNKLTELPAGYHLEYAGEAQTRAEAQQRLLWLSAASLAGIFVLLYLDFRSLRLSLVVMLSVPLAGVGGIAAIWASGGIVSLGSLVGLITVFGIAVRNGILLISNYRHLREQGMPFGPELILHGSVERLAAILMTAATTALAIIPLVVKGNLPGYEIEHPMAVVIVGGLVSSTFLTLFVVPALYTLVGAKTEDQGPAPV